MTSIHLVRATGNSVEISASCYIIRETFRPAFRRAISSTANGKVAIINVDYLINIQVGNRARVFKSSAVAQRFGIVGYNWKTHKEYRYSYKHEYLVWGSIEKEATVTDFSVGMFRLQGMSPVCPYRETMVALRHPKRIISSARGGLRRHQRPLDMIPKHSPWP